MTLICRLQFLLTGTLFVLIILGGGVRIADAGLSCPDWPLCFGEVVPPFNTQVFLEWFHRLIAGFAGLIQLALAVLILRRADARRLMGMGTILALFLFGVQAWLGGQTVIQLLRSEIVTSHLLGGYALFTLSLWLSFKARKLSDPFLSRRLLAPREFGRLLPVMSILAYFQAALGGLVSSHYAGLVCDGFPSCGGSWWPHGSGLQMIQMTHRYVAFFLAAMTIYLSIVSFKDFVVRRIALIALVGIGLQIIWGVLMLYTNLHDGLQLLHVITSLAFFSTLAFGSFYVRDC